MSEIPHSRRPIAAILWVMFVAVPLFALVLGFRVLTHFGTTSSLATMGGSIALLVMVFLGLTCWWVRRKQFGTHTIRGRLLVSFVLIALLPAVAIGAGAIVVGFYNGRQQALDRLESVAALREIELNTWTRSLQSEQIAALNEEYALDRARIVLDLAQHGKYYDYFNMALRYRLQRLAMQSERIDELFLVDLQGRVVLSTDAAREGSGVAGESFFEEGLGGTYSHLPFGPDSDDRTAVISVIQVTGDGGQLLGLMAARADVGSVYDILRDRDGLGTTGKAYLVDTGRALLADPSLAVTDSGFGGARDTVNTWAISAALENRANGSGVYNDLRGVTVVGVYRWLPEFEAALLIEQDLGEAFGAVYATLAVNVSIALVSLVLAVAASLFTTRSIANPLTDLVQTAREIAGGDLNRVAEVDRDDEVGVLARAFNSMTAQLRDLISRLEERVEERTQALRRRAVQLETSARVSREITSILDIDDLLRSVVGLIRDAFGYYQTHIFLIDEAAQELVMRASTADGNPFLRRLPSEGGSLNANAVGKREPVLVDDVAQDARYVHDDRLPDVQSELVVPLRVGTHIIGTLDVQSSTVNDFTSDDVLLIESLGDQIAIAIENARLYDQSRELATLEERNRLARELHDSITQSLFSLDLHAKAVAKYLGHDNERAEAQLWQLRQLTRDVLQEMRTLIFDLRPPALDDGGLAVALRQQVELLRRPDGPQLILQVEGDGRLSPEAELGLLRVAQEALSNATRHAHAAHITLTLAEGPSLVTLCVADDGCGFVMNPLSEERRGFGLQGMRERVEALDGCLQVVSQAGKGTRVTASVPIEE